jgi:hypothetical protein
MVLPGCSPPLQAALLRTQEAQDTDPFHELEGYLTSLLEPFCSLPDVAVIRWWKDHSIVYPTLARMAQDFLAIPGSSMASECQFSSTQHISTDFQNCLSPTMFEAIQMVKGGYKAGIISAHLEILALAKELDCTVDELLFDSNKKLAS